MPYTAMIEVDYLDEHATLPVKRVRSRGWTGQLLLFPRAGLEAMLTSPEQDLQHSGLYILLGRDAEKPSRPRVYIGESESLANRLRAHTKDPRKHFWRDTIVLTSTAGDFLLNKAEIRFLEAVAIERAMLVGKALRENSVVPARPKLSRADLLEMEDFWRRTRELLMAAGIDLFQPDPQPAALNDEENEEGNPFAGMASPVFQLKTRGIIAEMVILGRFYVILAGSQTTPEWTSGDRTYWHERHKLVAEGALQSMNDHLLFVKDAVFDSPSIAATVVAGAPRASRAWKTAEGTTIEDWEGMICGLPDLRAEEHLRPNHYTKSSLKFVHNNPWLEAFAVDHRGLCVVLAGAMAVREWTGSPDHSLNGLAEDLLQRGIARATWRDEVGYVQLELDVAFTSLHQAAQFLAGDEMGGGWQDTQEIIRWMEDPNLPVLAGEGIRLGI